MDLSAHSVLLETGFICSQNLFQKKTGRKLPVIPSKCLSLLAKIKIYRVDLCHWILLFRKREYVTKYSPWTVFSLITSRNFKLGAYITGVVLLLLIVVGMMLKERFFCQFLCPLGAVFSLLPKLPIFHVKKKGQQCFERCSACTNRCPVHLKYDEADIRDGECISWQMLCRVSAQDKEE